MNHANRILVIRRCGASSHPRPHSRRCCHPGSPVTELAVATESGVARVTAKAAVERLVRDGLLQRTANKSARVPVSTPTMPSTTTSPAASWKDLLSNNSPKKAASPKEPAKPSSLSKPKPKPKPVVHHEWGQVAESGDTFHRSLVDALGNFRLSRIFGSFMDETQLYQTQIHTQKWDLVAETSQDYAATITAPTGSIEARDPAQAARIIDTHLYKRCTRIFQQLQGANPTSTSTATIVRPNQWRREEHDSDR